MSSIFPMKKKQNPHKPGVDWAFFPRYQQRKDPSAKTCRCRAPRGADGLAVASAAGAVAASAGAALDLRPYENFSERIDLETTSKGELCNTPAGVLRRVVASVFSFERNIVLFVCVFSFLGCGEARFVLTRPLRRGCAAGVLSLSSPAIARGCGQRRRHPREI